VRRVLAGEEDHVPEKDRALYEFVRKMVKDSLSIGPDDVAAAHAAGWTDEALYDAISVVALFQFYNAWIDATGVRDMPALGYEMTGKRLSTQGYVMK
jgi:alkylhydroperoxidase family enzyme